MVDVKLAKKLISCCEYTLYASKLNESSLISCIKNASDKDNAPFCISVYPQFINLVKENICQDSEVKVSTVISWPKGGGSKEFLAAEVTNALREYGAHEIEYVVDYRKFDFGTTHKLYTYENIITHMYDVIREIKYVKSLVGSTPIKVVLELTSFNNPIKISALTRAAILGGADFICTATGKAEESFSSTALKYVLDEIVKCKQGEHGDTNENYLPEPALKQLFKEREEIFSNGVTIYPSDLRYLEPHLVGLKLQGSVSSFVLAEEYHREVVAVLGESYIVPQTFRIGSSALYPLLKEIISGNNDAIKLAKSTISAPRASIHLITQNQDEQESQ